MIKADPVLADFDRYCIDHPGERFWQALRNWSGYSKIIAATVYNDPVPDPNPLMLSGYREHQIDTFNWEGRRHDEG